MSYKELKSGTDVRGVASDIGGKSVNLTDEAVYDITSAFAMWLAEKNGVKTKLNLDKTSLKEKNITLVNFIEEEINEEIIDNTLLFKPFEVKTLWVRKDSKN